MVLDDPLCIQKLRVFVSVLATAVRTMGQIESEKAQLARTPSPLVIARSHDRVSYPQYAPDRVFPSNQGNSQPSHAFGK